MSNDAIQVLTYFPSLIWQLFTGFKIPGLNFTPAVFFFGILSFGLAFKFILGIINVSTTGFERTTFANTQRYKNNSERLRRQQHEAQIRRSKIRSGGYH